MKFLFFEISYCEKNAMNLATVNASIFFISKQFSFQAQFVQVLLESYNKSAVYNIVYLVRVISLRHRLLSVEQWMLSCSLWGCISWRDIFLEHCLSKFIVASRKGYGSISPFALSYSSDKRNGA
jgi:hypothetical protein